MISLTLVLAAAPQAAPQAPTPVVQDGPAIERFVIDQSRSVVGFDGTSTLHDFEGRCTVINGELRVDAENVVDSAGGTFWIPAKELSTDSGGRDKEMYHALDVEHFERIEFKLETVARDAGGKMSATGRFNIHGVSRARHFDFELAPLPEGGWQAKGGVSFNITDHGITPPSKVVVGMHDKVRVWFDLTYLPAKLEHVSAQSYGVELSTLTEPLNSEAQSSTATATVWIDGQHALLERASDWILAGQRDAALISPKLASSAPMGAASESGFADSQALVASLRSKLAKLKGKSLAKIGPKLEASIARTMESLAFAPAAGPAQIVRTDDEQLTIELGGEVWASFHSLEGDAPFPAALAAMEGIPAEVRKALQQLRGVPTRFFLRTAQPTRRTTISGTLSTARAVSAPAWIFDPSFFGSQTTAAAPGQ